MRPGSNSDAPGGKAFSVELSVIERLEVIWSEIFGSRRRFEDGLKVLPH